jgi:hypothetical protein
MFLESRAWPVREAHNLVPPVSRLSRECGILTFRNPRDLHGLLRAQLYPFKSPLIWKPVRTGHFIKQMARGFNSI